MKEAIIKVKNDPSWKDTGHNKYLTKSIKPSDPKFHTDSDLDSTFEDRAIKVSQMGLGGSYIAVTPYIDDAYLTLDNTDAGHPELAQGTVSLTVKTPPNDALFNMSQNDIALYLGDGHIGTGAYLIPGGANVDESEFQMIGPWYDAHRSFQQHYTVLSWYIRRIPSDSVIIGVLARARSIGSTNKNIKANVA